MYNNNFSTKAFAVFLFAGLSAMIVAVVSLYI